jgi:CSLREA domain-containing protein
MITVAATNPYDQKLRNSHFGASSVDLAAPGASIYSTWPRHLMKEDYGYSTGTSMAAPHVSGAAALLWSRMPDATVAEVRSAILEGVDKLPGLEGLVATGGRLNLYGALTVDTYAPRVSLELVEDITSGGNSAHQIHVAYRDNIAIKHASLDGNDLRVIAPGSGELLPVTVKSTSESSDSENIQVVYELAAPGGSWTPADNGVYQVMLQEQQVGDVNGVQAVAGLLGSFEVDLSGAAEFIVNSLEDTVDVNVGDGYIRDAAGKITLRAAIQETNALAGANTVYLPAGTYTLTRAGADEDQAATGDLDIRDNLTIIGSGQVTIDAGELDRVFDIADGAALTLRGVTVTGGKTADAGGGLRNAGGTVIVEQVTLTGNQAGSGGALANDSDGIVVVSSSTISANTATTGAGISNDGGTITVTSSTVTGNAATQAGGLANLSGTVNLKNTIIAGNTASLANPDVSGVFVSVGNNLVGKLGNATGLTHGSSADLVGTVSSPIDPLLGPLADNGGVMLTHLPLPGSPAIDAGNNSGAPAVDQRGLPVPQDGTGSGQATVEIGAVERYYAEIRGTHFHDHNANGARDVGDEVLANWDVFLDMDGDQQQDDTEPVTTTDENGVYVFAGLAPGEYSVIEVNKTGWRQTLPAEIVVATTDFLVNSTADKVDTNPGDGLARDADGNTTLRAAIMEANEADGPISILLPAGSYLLSLAGTGENDAATGDLDIKNHVTIVGAGAGLTTIDADDKSRLFDIMASASLQLRDVTLTGGNQPALFADDYGGAIWNRAGGTLVVERGVLSGSQAKYAGGLYNEGTATISSTTIDSNQATISGGGIVNTGTLTVQASTISGNTAVDYAGIRNISGVATLDTVTISGNIASNDGGAIGNENFGVAAQLVIRDSTIVANTASASGGGTVAGGIRATSDGSVHVANSIIAGNIGTADLVGTFVSDSYNLVGNPGTAEGFVNAVKSDKVGSSGSPLDPLLGPLRDNGGLTWTHAVLPGSPAEDVVDRPLSASQVDQRGVSRFPSLSEHTLSDIGAYEFHGISEFTVTTTADTVDAAPGDGAAEDAEGNTSLRAAVMEANALGGKAEITLPAGEYILTRSGAGEDAASTGDLDVTGDITIVGAGVGTTILDGDLSDRLFDIIPDARLRLEGMTLQRGLAAFAGAIASQGDLELDHTLFAGNKASSSGENIPRAGGGAIHHDGGQLSIVASSFLSNISEDVGGAISLVDGTVTISDTTFFDNSTVGHDYSAVSGSGGAIVRRGNDHMSIEGSTFSANRTGRSSGGAIAVFNLTAETTAALNTTTIINSTFTDRKSVV